MVQDKVWGRVALPAVAVGVLAVSAAIFIRLAEAPAVAVAFWRCALGAAVLVPPAVCCDAGRRRPALGVLRGDLVLAELFEPMDQIFPFSLGRALKGMRLGR